MADFNKLSGSPAPETWRYEPFAVEDGWLLTAYPQLAPVQATLESYGDSKTLQPLTPAAAKSRLTPNRDAAEATLYNEVLPHALRFRLQDDQDPEAADSRLREYIVGVNKPLAEATNITDYIVDYARESAVTFKNFRHASKGLMAAIDGSEASSAFGYELTKLIATTIPRPQPSNYEWPARNVFLCLLFLGQSALPAQLKETVEGGGFDSFIAADLLHFVRREGTDVQNGMLAIHDLLQFSQSISPDTAEATVVSRMAANHQAWPKDQTDAFKNNRKRLLVGYERAVSWVQSPAAAGEYLQVMTDQSDPPATLTKVLEKYFDQAGQPAVTAAGIASPPPGINKRRIRFDALQASQQRRRRSGKQAGTQALAEVFAGVEAEKILPSWELVVLRPDGSVETGEDTETVAASLAARYLEEYKYAADHPIATVLQGTLDKLRRLDFSSGNVPGVKKLTTAAIKVGDNTDVSYALMEYKPMEVPGAALAAERAKKLRILFAMTAPKTLGVLKVIERDDVYTYLRRIGVNASGRKG